MPNLLDGARTNAIVGVFVLLFLVLAVSSPDIFLSLRNMSNILDQSSVPLIFAATTVICIVAGIFDLSIAAVAATSAIATVLAINVVGLVLGLVLGVTFGALLGVVSGLLITGTGVNSFIGTLAAAFTYLGLGLVFASGGLVRVEDAEAAAQWRIIVQGTYLGLKGQVWIALIFVLVLSVLLSRTVFGRQVYAVGGNIEAARLAGIKTRRVLVTCYALSGIGAGLNGALYVGRVSSGAPNAFTTDDAFTAIAAVVVGGVSIFGGIGAVWRGVLGVLTFALISNGLNLLGVDTTYRLTILGVLIFVAVAADQMFRRRGV
jgi:ribose transport system permease protein